MKTIDKDFLRKSSALVCVLTLLISFVVVTHWVQRLLMPKLLRDARNSLFLMYQQIFRELETRLLKPLTQIEILSGPMREMVHIFKLI